TLVTAQVTIPIGTVYHPKQWANALVQITSIQNTKERLLFQGLCYENLISEDKGILTLKVCSLWEIFNLNTTLDYTAPKKYGLQNLDEGVVINVGNETQIGISESDLFSSYTLSERYMHPGDETFLESNRNSSESFKLYNIINRTPMAERFAFSLFDLMVYGNFILSKSYIDRFKLLSKSSGEREIQSKLLAEVSIGISLQTDISYDLTRTGINYQAYLNDAQYVSKNGCISPTEIEVE